MLAGVLAGDATDGKDVTGPHRAPSRRAPARAHAPRSLPSADARGQPGPEPGLQTTAVADRGPRAAPGPEAAGSGNDSGQNGRRPGPDTATLPRSRVRRVPA